MVGGPDRDTVARRSSSLVGEAEACALGGRRRRGLGGPRQDQ